MSAFPLLFDLTTQSSLTFVRQFYDSLLSALQRFPTAEASSPAARTVAVRLVKAAISLPTRLEFDDLIALNPVQALAKSDPELFNLLEVFAGGDLEDYEEFNDVHENWLGDNGWTPILQKSFPK